MDKTEAQDIGPPLEEWDDTRVQSILRIWEKTVDVQQHFNNLELRVRSLALTTLTVVLGGAAYAYAYSKEIPVTDPLQIPAWFIVPFLLVAAIVLRYIFFEEIPVRFWVLGIALAVVGVVVPAARGWDPVTVPLPPLASLLLLVALVIWSGFYVMDRLWYHRLLYGSVKQGLAIEKRLEKILPESALTDAIGKESPIVSERHKLEMRSPHKIDFFYGLVALVLFALVFIT